MVSIVLEPEVEVEVVVILLLEVGPQHLEADLTLLEVDSIPLEDPSITLEVALMDSADEAEENRCISRMKTLMSGWGEGALLTEPPVVETE